MFNRHCFVTTANHSGFKLGLIGVVVLPISFVFMLIANLDSSLGPPQTRLIAIDNYLVVDHKKVSITKKPVFLSTTLFYDRQLNSLSTTISLVCGGYYIVKY